MNVTLLWELEMNIEQEKKKSNRAEIWQDHNSHITAKYEGYCGFV
jgi:hypothetical protein